MYKKQVVNELLNEMREFDRKLKNKELSIDNYLFLKNIVQNNLVWAYSDIIEELEKSIG